jgi:hypothetical protein
MSDDDDALARAISALTPWHQQYKRMMRWRARLDEPGHDKERRLDDFYAFVVAAYHLADWIENDETVDEAVRDAESDFRKTKTVGYVGDLANGYKHMKRRPGSANFDEDARFSVYGTFATFEPDEPPETWAHLVAVVGKDIPMQDAYELADRCIGEWDVFLHEHGLTTPPS